MAPDVPCAVCGDPVYLDESHTQIETEPKGHEGPPTTYRICLDCEADLNEPVP